MRLRGLPFVLGMGIMSFAPSAAEAFCGFYVSGADAKLYNNATVVVMMREGTRTVLAMQNNYQGPAEGFAMVVPVPIVLQKENVKTLPREIFDKVDQLAAPRLVEYWEQDPCSPNTHHWNDNAKRGLVVVASSQIQLGVKVEAQFVVGEYEIVVLSANDSVGLDKWLRQEKYKIPEGAEPFLRPYVQSGMKFFVAKVNPAKVKFENGSAMLSPLRFHYDAETFNLPVRLGLVNSAGTQDLLVHIIAKDQRYEVANYPNATIPTNIDVAEDVSRNFGAFYAALFDKTLEKSRGAVVTEYAWGANSCDPCPGPIAYGLSGDDLMSLGADVLPSTAASYRPAVTYAQPPEVKPASVHEPSLYREIVSVLHGKLTQCYQAAFEANPSLAASFDLVFNLSPTGSASGVSTKGDALNPKVSACVTKAVTQTKWPSPASGSGSVSVKLPVRFFRASSFSGGNYVLTRLHARYSKDALGEDLIFRAAPPIIGGNETRDASGKLDHGPRPSSVNLFQGRYAIRHPWKEKVECGGPVRGVWGPPPGQGRIQAKPAADIAFAPRGGVSLVSLLKEDVPALGIAIPGGSGSIETPLFSEPDPQAKPSPKPAATAAQPPPPPPPAGGCAACAVMPSQSDEERNGQSFKSAAAAISAIAATFVAGLRRSRRRR